MVFNPTRFESFTCSTKGCWLGGALWASEGQCPNCGSDRVTIELVQVLTYGDFLHKEDFSHGEDEETSVITEI